MSKLDRIDKFGIDAASKEDYLKKQEYVIKNCRCPKCPTYVAGDAPVGYCYPLIGTSQKIQWEKECICGTCPIYKEYELSHSFYCTRCSSSCQTLKTEGPAAQGT